MQVQKVFLPSFMVRSPKFSFLIADQVEMLQWPKHYRNLKQKQCSETGWFKGKWQQKLSSSHLKEIQKQHKAVYYKIFISV